MHYPDLEIDLLRAFVAVAETGSFTAAADVVGRSQSAVSQKVLRLEEILDRRVFDRTSRSLSLTKDGERLLVTARRMLEFNDAAMRELREPQAVGTLRLGISEDFIPASSLMGVQAAVAGGLGVTVLGRSFMQEGMQILTAPEHWPSLPMTEVVILGEDSEAARLVQPFVAFLTESLSKQRSLSLVA